MQQRKNRAKYLQHRIERCITLEVITAASGCSSPARTISNRVFERIPQCRGLLDRQRTEHRYYTPADKRMQSRHLSGADLPRYPAQRLVGEVMVDKGYSDENNYL